MAHAYIIAEQFIDNNPSLMILGDNIFFGAGLSNIIKTAMSNKGMASVFGYQVSDPSRYGIVEFDKAKKVVSIEEKPIEPKSDYAITGLYFLDEKAVTYAKQVIPSQRGELEITSLLNIYLKKNTLNLNIMNRGFSWLDVGTHESLLDAANFVRLMQKRHNLIIGSPEEIAFRNGWIDKIQVQKLSEKYSNSIFGKYLLSLVEP